MDIWDANRLRESRSQAECFALTASYEGNNGGDENNPKLLEYPKEQKNTLEVSSIESLY